MALFQNKPAGNELSLPYTLSVGGDTLLIIGLGNPGNKYTNTRHNIGFSIIEEIAKQENFQDFKLHKKFNSQITENTLTNGKVILAKPQTFMNESGQSIRAIMDFYKIPINKILVIHDELSINFGQIRARVGGQAAGHNGIKSVMSHVGADFGRLRVGIKNDKTPQTDTSNFVLAKFSKKEQQSLEPLIKESALMANEYIYSKVLPHDTRSIMII